MIIRSLALAGLLALSACSTATSMLTPTIEVERDLMNTDRAFSALSASQGMAAAFNAYMDPRQGAMIRPGGMSEGSDAIAKDMAGATPDVGLTWAPDRVYASNSGDFGVTSGRFTRTIAGKQTAQGRYVTVWRKTGGAWKALMDIGNTDPAPTP